MIKNLLLLLLLLCLGSHLVTGDSLVVVHRHGARTPVSNVSGSCGAQKCGELTPSGAAMLRSLGNYLRTEYDDILPAKYRLSLFDSQSDTVSRTIQSASALIKGIFEFNSSIQVYPVITTTSAWRSMDNLLVPLDDPAYVFHAVQTGVASVEYFVAQYMNANITATVTAVANELNVSDCESDLPGCFLDVTDFLFVMETEGKLSKYPVGRAALPLLYNLTTTYVRTLYVQYPQVTDPTFAQRVGFPAAALAKAIVASLEESSTEVFTEFSGHDNTLVPLYVTLGDDSFSYPAFGTALLFHGFTVNGSRWVRARLGSPVQDEIPAFPYNFSSYTLRCLNSSGSSYQVGEEGCPLADFQRYVNSHQPPTSLGNCAVTQDGLAAANCTAEESLDPLSPYEMACSIYRNYCPFSCCGDKRFLAADGNCRKK